MKTNVLALAAFYVVKLKQQRRKLRLLAASN